MIESLTAQYRPDILNCIANLSNDEVLTPPTFANQMLDCLALAWAEEHNGANIWSDPNVTFLDPFTKSGVFLREISGRLVEGLAEHIPDLQERVDHILTKQVFGIAITTLTSMLSRRSLYCSKTANQIHSICTKFDNESGNIWFERTEHSWTGGKREYRLNPTTGEDYPVYHNRRCKYCGVNESDYSRGPALESHAYAFIHTEDIKQFLSEAFGETLKFDVIIGNPPYQLSDGGGEGASAIPLYHRFVQQAKKLEPAHIVMVTPARWYSGGKGLDDFRREMLLDEKLAEIHDFPETELVFPGVNIRGGVSYFRRSASHSGRTRVINYSSTEQPSQMERQMRTPGADVFVRYNKAVSILEKIQRLSEPTMNERVYSRNVFGIPSNFSKYSTSRTNQNSLLLYRSRRGSTSDREVFISPNEIKKNRELTNRIKVLVSKASPGGDEYPHSVFSQPIVADSGSAATETYLVIDTTQTIAEAEHLANYMRTRFFRFLVSLIKSTQNISKGSFAFVPIQDWSEEWPDERLYSKYRISQDEIDFIESIIRPMEV